MSVYHKQLTIRSAGQRVTYHNIRQEVVEAVAESKIGDGIVVIQTPHTTCSVIFEEMVHDTDFNGDEYLQVDMNRLLDRMIPRELSENTDYRYPGPKHVDFLHDLNKVDPSFPVEPATILNGDAHIRASLFGESVTLVVKGGVAQLGSVGYIYFIDWDQNRVRDRKCHICIIGE